MSFLNILKDLGLLVLGAYGGGAASVFIKDYNFFTFINGLVKEYIFRIKPKTPPIVQ